MFFLELWELFYGIFHNKDIYDDKKAPPVYLSALLSPAWSLSRTEMQEGSDLWQGRQRRVSHKLSQSGARQETAARPCGEQPGSGSPLATWLLVTPGERRNHLHGSSGVRRWVAESMWKEQDERDF